MNLQIRADSPPWTGPLAWGQRSIWNAIQKVGPKNDRYFNFTRIARVPRKAPAADVPAVLAAVRTVVERHDSLRCRVLVDADGEPYQVVEPSGTIPVEIVTSVAEGERLQDTRFDFTAEWPLRVALVVSGERVETVVLVFGHTGADGAGGDLVARDLRLTLLRGAPPARGEQLRELVAAQQGPDLPRSRRAIDHWGRESLHEPLLVNRCAPGGGVRYQRMTLFSPALDVASRVLARRYHVSGSTILLTAACLLVGRASGRGRGVMTPLVSNRHLKRHGEVVTSLTQLGLFALDVGCTDFDEVMVSAKHAAMSAYRNAYFDPMALGSQVSEASPLCCFNDMRVAGTTDVVIPGEIDSLLGGSAIEKESGLEELNCRFCVQASGEPGQLRMRVTADTHYLAPADIETFLREMESLLVSAARNG